MSVMQMDMHYIYITNVRKTGIDVVINSPLQQVAVDTSQCSVTSYLIHGSSPP